MCEICAIINKEIEIAYGTSVHGRREVYFDLELQ